MSKKKIFKGLAIPNEKSIVKTIRIPESVHAKIQRKANKYANGNMGAYLRYVGLRYEPKKEELVDVEAGQ